jgi:serine/threonine protein kinase
MAGQARGAGGKVPNIRVPRHTRVGTDQLGSGGFSWVLLYKHTTMGESLRAVKILHEKVGLFRRRAYRDESSTIASLSHRYIAQVFDRGFGAGHPYIVMEYYPETLWARRDRTMVEAVEVGVKLASAVAYMHRKGVIHCDIKPANIMLRGGDPFLTDFGAAEQFTGDPSNMTVPAPVPIREANGAHSPLWAAREQFLGAMVTPATDVFGLAATVYWLLEGRSPYQKPGEVPSHATLVERGRRGTAFPIQRDMPAQLRTALENALHPQLDLRTQTATEFGSQLSAVLASLGSPLPADILSDDDSTITDSSGADASALDVTETLRFAPRPSPAPGTTLPSIFADSEFELESTLLREGDLEGGDTTAGELEGADTAYRDDGQRDPDRRTAPRGPARTLILVAASVVLVAAVAAGAAVLTQAPTEGGTPDATGVSPSGTLGNAPIPTPDLVSATADPASGTVTFVWSNPAAETGDSYIWKRTDGPNDSQQMPTTEPRAEVADVASSDSVCIEVVVRRQGRTSATPLETCYPQ